MTAVVDVDRDARVVQHVAVEVLEVARVLQDVAREIDDLDALHAWMQRRRIRRVADAEAQDEHPFRVLDEEQRDVRHRAHVAL